MGSRQAGQHLDGGVERVVRVHAEVPGARVVVKDVQHSVWLQHAVELDCKRERTERQPKIKTRQRGDGTECTCR
eukprot:6182000-Pleurochrysis_carterae.AAC.4